MKLVFLGTSAAHPTTQRGLSCTCIERDGEILMFDAGEATQIAFMRSGLRWNKKMRLFITHMHGDHCIGILGLLQTMSMQGRTLPLEIYGPPGIAEFVSANIRILGFGLSFSIMINPVHPGDVLDGDGYVMHTCRASHSVTALSYVLEEKDKPGRFDTAKAKNLGVPEGSLWGKLQRGQDVTVEINERKEGMMTTTKKVIKPEQILGSNRPGKKIGISGDTMPTPELEKFFTKCDYLIFDSTFLEGEKQKALETRHSTAAQAAGLAYRAGVKTLILTHFSARYKDDTGHLKEATKIHGSVIAARDLLEIEIV